MSLPQPLSTSPDDAALPPTSARRPIRPTRLGRLADYLAQLFPPALYVPSGIASFLSVYFALQALAAPGPLRLTWRACVGAATVVLLTLLMRVYDELKDVDSDVRLGQAGDPKYRERCVVTGHVRVEDLRALRWWVSGVLVALNLLHGPSLPLLAFAGVFLLLWLSFRWFFWPAIQRSLLLAFITHNPIALAFAGYVVAVAVADFGTGVLTPTLLPLLLASWLPISAWETSRKVRHAPDETAYQTYSQVLGWKVAAWLPAFFVLAATTCHLVVASAAGLGPAFPVVAGLAALLAVGACARFRLAPSTASANLRPFVEVHVVAVTVGLPLALALARGVRWGG
jgi:hypothetical protein